jgi:hypothetical protein
VDGAVSRTKTTLAMCSSEKHALSMTCRFLLPYLFSLSSLSRYSVVQVVGSVSITSLFCLKHSQIKLV